MKILYIYRHPDMGYSIGKVFHPIESYIKKYAEVDSVYLPVPNYSLKGLYMNIMAAKRAVANKKYDVVHITGTEHYLIPFINRKNLIVTVHDLGSIIKTGGLIKKILFIKFLRLAKKITFISEFSKKEADEIVSIEDERKIVIGNPYDILLRYTSKQVNVSKPTVLHVGTKENKNLIRTIEALSDFSCHLRIVGKIPEYVISKLNEHNIEYSNVSDLSDKEIYEEYKNCDIVSFCSTYEGFGMPIIEGNAVGRVVITSNIEPMKTVSGGACVLVDPYDVFSIKEGFLEALQNNDFYIKKGLENAKKYTVEYISKQYLELYKKISI